MGRPKAVYDFLLKFWPLSKTANWLGNQPVIGSLVRPVFNRNEYESIILPVQEAVHQDESVILPYELLAPLVEKSDARVALNHCICRHAEGCGTYPQELGCLFLGEGALQISRSLGTPVDTQTALDHLERGMKLGLVPLVVHASFDAFVLGIPYRRMLAVCFCCDCCCSIRHGLRLGPRAFWDTVVRLPGLTVEVGENCAGCGECESACLVNAIRVEYGRARIHPECKACGRCVEACPTDAISMRLDNRAEVMREFMTRIERRTNIGKLNGHERPEPGG